MARVRIPLWVVVGIILIGLFLSQGRSFVPLTISVAVAGLVLQLFSRGADRLFGVILLIAGVLFTFHECSQSKEPRAAREASYRADVAGEHQHTAGLEPRAHAEQAIAPRAE